jgi:hypothetical protein
MVVLYRAVVARAKRPRLRPRYPKIQAPRFPRSMSAKPSFSIDRASRADTPNNDRTMTVAMPVPTGKCHNIQSIEAEDRARMLKKPKMLVRFCADFVMPAPERKRDLCAKL